MRVAIIPARGGSKRIPRKNIRPFLGRPMISYSIAAALASGCIDRVIVSTDDEEIAAVARAHGAETPFLRPAALADEFTGTGPVMRHAIEWLQANPGPSGAAGAAATPGVTEVCCLYATAPFVQAEALRQGYELLRTSGKVFVFAVTSFAFPVQRAVCLNARGEIEELFPGHAGTRSQDLPEALHDAGQFYWGPPSSWLEGRAMFAPHSLPIRIPRYLVQDIDTEEDWRCAEFMYQALRAAGILPTP